MTYAPFNPAKPANNDLRVSSDVRNNLNALFNGDGSPLRPRAQSTPNMTIQVAGCDVESFFRQCWIGILIPFNFAGENSPNIIAPSTNPRIALLTIDSAGILAWTYGDEAASPIAPNCPEQKIPICYVYEKTTMSKIVNYEDAGANPNEGYIYRDVRPFLNLGGTAVSPVTNFQSLTKIFGGDGSDGDVTISSNTVLPDSGIGVKVMRYNNLTINSGVYLRGHANDRVLALLIKETLTLNGSILMNGNGAVGGAAITGQGPGNPGGAGAFGGGAGGGGAATARGGGGGGGGQPGAPANDGSGNGGGKLTNTHPLTLAFGFGLGIGGQGEINTAGGAGQRLLGDLNSPITFEIAKYLYGGGGGSGATEGAVDSGVGGNGGGVIWIETKSIVWGGAGLMNAGGNGGGQADEGEGGGGAGGFIQVVYKSKTGNSTLQVAGGAGSTAGAGPNGGNGIDGIKAEFQVE